MPTLGEFHTLVRDSINLGDSIDARILAAVRQAVLWLERNYNFRYMHHSDIFFFAPPSVAGPIYAAATGQGPYQLQGLPKKVDTVYTWESTSDSSTLYFLERIQKEDADTVETCRPFSYYTEGDGPYFYIGQLPDIVYYGYFKYWGYSTWPALTAVTMYTSAATHWLVTYAEDLLLHQTMMQLAPILRDPEMGASAKPLRDEALRTLLLTEDEFQDSDRSQVMNYRGYSYGRDENA